MRETTPKSKSLEDRQKIFSMRVIAWRAFADMFGGWGKAAKHFKVKKAELQRTVLDDLERTWGEPLDWMKAFENDGKEADETTRD